MGAPSRETTINQLVEALVSVEGFPLTEEDLKNFISQTKVLTKTKQNKTRATSAHEVWKSDNKGTKSTQSWVDFKKENPEALIELQNRADKINEDRNLPSKAEAKAQKNKKNAEEKKALQKELLKIKEDTQNILISKNNSNEEPDQEPQDKSTDDIFEKADKNGDGVISREEFNDFIQKNSNNDTSDTENEPEEVSKDKPEEEPDEELEEEPKEESEKPKYTGKNRETALNNFKQWKLNQLGKPPNQSIPREELKDYQEEDGFDKNIYDESCDWFEYIKNNMS